MRLALAFLGSYLVGAIPTSYLVGRLRGVDLRTMGSGNLGATNTYRVLGWRWAVPVGLVDIAKGVLPVMVLGGWARGGEGTTGILPLLLGCTAVLGHAFSVFVGFKGGKGVATGAGVVLAIAPLAFLAVLLLWTALVLLTGYVSVGSLAAAVLFPFAAWMLHPSRRDDLWIDILLALLIVGLHRTNIVRLARGTERRFGRHAGEGTTPSPVPGRRTP